MKSQNALFTLLVLTNSILVLADEWDSDDSLAVLEDFALGYATASCEKDPECKKAMAPGIIIGLFIFIIMCLCGCIPKETDEEMYRRERQESSGWLGLVLGYALGCE
jgi:hypothetical protein